MSFSCFIIRPVTVGLTVNYAPTQALAYECCPHMLSPLHFFSSYPVHLCNGPRLDLSPGPGPSLSSASFPGLDPSLGPSPLHAPTNFLIPSGLMNVCEYKRDEMRDDRERIV